MAARNDFPQSIDRAGLRMGFARVEYGQVHYLTAGSGPAVVLLHDSPRSARLHIDTMRALASHYTVVALDTPGYGLSDPLPNAVPTIADFAEALDATLDAMGLSGVPLYATHTSAKIAIEYAARTAKPSRLVLDGLSIADSLAADSFVDAYMRPFVIEATGAYIAAEWQRTRDMLRWFPWFAPSPATRMAMNRPADAWIESYTIDLFSAGPHYADAYAAAMRYDPRPALQKVRVPTIVGARSDDVLHASLAKVPVSDNACLSIARLGADRADWLAWIERSLASALPHASVAARAEPADDKVYVEHAHGQMLLHQTGPVGAPPLLILEAPGPLAAFAWQQALPEYRCIVPELPGCGQSDPLPPGAGMAELVSALDAAVAFVGSPIDVLAIGHGAAIALALAAANPAVARIVLDGLPHRDVDAGALCPRFAFSTAGAHLHETFHMLRDREVQYPWYAGEASARRLTEPVLDAPSLHSALLATIKQPAHYGHALAIALQAADAAPPATTEALVFTLASDPFYARAADIAAHWPNATPCERPVALADAAWAIRKFLQPRE